MKILTLGVTLLFAVTSQAQTLNEMVAMSHAVAPTINYQEGTDPIWFPIVLEERFIRVYRADLAYVGAFVQSMGTHYIFVIDNRITEDQLMPLVVHESNHLAKMYVRDTQGQICSADVTTWEPEAYTQEEIYRQFVNNTVDN